MGKASHIIMAEAILERAVLNALCEGREQQGDEFYFSSAYIERQTGIGCELVRALLRQLVDRGLASYCRGLMTEDGQLAGSGYAATLGGVAQRRVVS